MKEKVNKNKPPYSIGWLCLIPGVGFIVGLVLLINGSSKYNDRKMMVIGSAGMIFSILVFFMFMNSALLRKNFASVSQQYLNTLTRNLELYKLEHGSYPDSLQQLTEDYTFVPISDPVARWNSKNRLFNYKNMGDKYLLFSTGVDRKENTKDDLYPTNTSSDTSKIKFNYIKRE